MKKNCLHCNKEYEISQFGIDNGYCRKCKPGFFSLPKQTSPAETKSLLNSLIGLNIFLFFISSLILDGGTISHPAMFFYGGTIIYLTVRHLIGSFSAQGYPCLTVMQRLALMLFPFYGLPSIFIIWTTIRKVFFND